MPLSCDVSDPSGSLYKGRRLQTLGLGLTLLNAYYLLEVMPCSFHIFSHASFTITAWGGYFNTQIIKKTEAQRAAENCLKSHTHFQSHNWKLVTLPPYSGSLATMWPHLEISHQTTHMPDISNSKWGPVSIYSYTRIHGAKMSCRKIITCVFIHQIVWTNIHLYTQANNKWSRKLSTN